MKLSNVIIAVFTAGFLLAGCKEDNFAPPKSTLSGRVVYQNAPVGVRSNGVQLELWQRGFQLFSKIPLHIAQDGTFSASLFDGDYKLVRLRGNGPWVDNTDTIEVQVRGSATIDVPVQPYFTIKNEKFQKSGTALTVSCKVDPVLTTRAIERVTVYVGTTQYVDVNNNVGSINIPTAALADLTKELSINYPLPAAVSTRAYFYARVGVKATGVAELLYTPVQKIQ
ncbi:DUF3823 domain-containing protein [Larkinella ripae]